ncbi:MAG: SpoIIE family protein phosphatase, partial [Actinomycetota bacterium]|nr:SpoIIE family protein phosphatase [Actinomycetota bacterium]
LDTGHDGQVFVAAYMLAPFFAAVTTRTWVTAVVSAVCVGCAVASGAWNDNLGSGDYFLRLAVVTLGASFAIFGAWLRERMDRSVEQLGILDSIAEIADGSLPIENAVKSFCSRLVPELADLCILDATVDGEVRRLGVAASGPRAEWMEKVVGGRTPPAPDAPTGSSRAIVRRQPQLISEIDDSVLRGISHDEEDLRLLRELDPRSVAVVPLQARDRALGALTLITADSRRRLTRADFRFLQLVGGRAALALDNAGLFRELSSVERQLETVLHNLADAVTVQAADGRLVYANQAAAELLGATSEAELLATPAEDIVSRFDSFTEEGGQLDIDQIPGRKVMRGESAEPLLVRALNRATGEERWQLIKASPVPGPGGEPALIVNIIQDVTAAKRSELHQRLLADASRALASSLDLEAILQEVAEMAVPQFADWCAVTLPRDDGLLEQVAVAHIDPDKVHFARELNARFPSWLDERGLGETIRERRSGLSDVPDELLRKAAHDDEHFELLKGLGLRSVISVPISSGERASGAIGAISFVTAESGRTFDQADLPLAEELGRRAGVAIENARLYSERAEVARTLEQALLPQELPAIPGWRISSLYRPASDESDVGGDFYDAFPIEGGWMMAMGDVCGRGVDAASVTALARYTLRTAGSLSGDMVTALTQLNSWLLQRGEGADLCTAVIVVLRDSGEVQIVNAGHPPPLLMREGEVSTVEAHGPMLGFSDDASWPVESLTLAPDDQLFLYTDGVIELAGEHDRFGEARLRATLAGADEPDAAVDRVRRALYSFADEPDDDIAMITVMREGQAVSAAPEASPKAEAA